jgi:hypothetical protein
VKASPGVLKVMKSLHLFIVFTFSGGILAASVLVFLTDWRSAAAAVASTLSLQLIFNDLVRIGAVGSVLVGICYGQFTQWGFLKHRWIALKWAVLIAQVAVGIGVVDRAITGNVAVAISGAAVIGDPGFASRLGMMRLALGFQLVMVVIAILLSVYKPRRRANSGTVTL